MPKLKKSKTGVYMVGFDTAHGRKWRSTKAKTIDDARKVVAAAKVAELEMAAKAKALTQESLAAIMAGRKVTCQTAMQEWTDWMGKRSSANTVHSYSLAITRFLEEQGLMSKPVTAVTDETIDEWVNAEGAGVRTNRAHRLAALRSFFTLCSSRAYCVGDPSLAAKVNHRVLTSEQKEPQRRVPFTEAEYRKILHHTEGFWKWASMLAWWTGLRLSDICTLEWSAWRDDSIIVHTLKRDRRVALPISHPAIGGGVLELVHLEMMDQKTSERYCFPLQAMDIMDPSKRSKFSVAFGRILDRLSIYNRSFHCFRHSFVSRLAKDGIDLEKIGSLVGHSSTKTTEVYRH